MKFTRFIFIVFSILFLSAEIFAAPARPAPKHSEPVRPAPGRPEPLPHPRPRRHERDELEDFFVRYLAYVEACELASRMHDYDRLDELREEEQYYEDLFAVICLFSIFSSRDSDHYRRLRDRARKAYRYDRHSPRPAPGPAPRVKPAPSPSPKPAPKPAPNPAPDLPKRPD